MLCKSIFANLLESFLELTNSWLFVQIFFFCQIVKISLQNSNFWLKSKKNRVGKFVFGNKNLIKMTQIKTKITTEIINLKVEQVSLN